MNRFKHFYFTLLLFLTLLLLPWNRSGCPVYCQDKHDHTAESAETGHVGEETAADGHTEAEHAAEEHAGEEPAGVHLLLPPQNVAIMKLKFASAQLKDLTVTYDCFGWVRPRPEEIFLLRAPLDANLKELHVKPGDLVKKDDSLVTLYVSELHNWEMEKQVLESKRSFLEEQIAVLLSQGQKELVDLFENLAIAYYENQSASQELSLLEKAGIQGVTQREIMLKQNEVLASKVHLGLLSRQASGFSLSDDDIRKVLDPATSESGYPEFSENQFPPEIRMELLTSRNELVQANENFKMLAERLTLYNQLMPADQGNKKIVAPFDGIVTDLYITPPSPVSTEEKILQLINYHHVLIESEIPEVDIARIRNRPEINVSIYVPGLENKRMEGTVSYMDTRINPEERMAHLFIDMENTPDQILRDGMTANIAIPVETVQNVLIIPKTAIIKDQLDSIVFVRETPEEFKKVIVTPGKFNLENIEIKEGLKAGEEVVTEGGLSLLIALQKQQGKGGDLSHGHAH